MLYCNYSKEEIYPEDNKKIKEVNEFLKKLNLNFEKDITYTLVYRRKDNIVATGSISGNVLKCLAIDPKWQNEGLLNQLIIELITREQQDDNQNFFVFTKPEYKEKFRGLGFKEIYTVERKITLMEFGINSINDFQQHLIQNFKLEEFREKKTTALIMNCNPFTYGHQYLVGKASIESDYVIVFVVKENRSFFSTSIRYELIKKGTEKFSNVFVMEGSDYIISSATFPSYFTQQQEVASLHATLDLNIFGKYIAPVVGINWRYVGEEPYCKTTNLYNKKMKEILPKYNINVKIIGRKKLAGEAISAFKVRQLLAQGKIERTKKYVPPTTYEFLNSSRAKNVIKMIKGSDSRH